MCVCVCVCERERERGGLVNRKDVKGKWEPERRFKTGKKLVS